MFPPHLAQRLESATAEQLAAVEVLGAGYGLHWEAPDVDLSTPGLLAGLFGTKSYMARHAGRATSPPKAAAARVNGAKGGAAAQISPWLTPSRAGSPLGTHAGGRQPAIGENQTAACSPHGGNPSRAGKLTGSARRIVSVGSQQRSAIQCYQRR